MSELTTQKSAIGFVRSSAWTAIALSILTLVLIGFELLLISLLGSLTDLPEGIRIAKNNPDVPELVQLLAQWLPALLFSIVSLVILGMIAGLGLLRLKQWARYLMIALLLVGVIGNLLGIWVQHLLLPKIAELLSDPIFGLGNLVAAPGTLYELGSAAIAIVFSAGFAWMAKRFFDSDVAELFKPREPH